MTSGLFAPRKHTEMSMTWMLVNRSKLVDLGRQIVIPNAYYGVGLSWEADLLLISEAGYLTEIEIKVSKPDLLADEHKHKFKISGFRQKIKRFYYAIPEYLEADFPKHYQNYAGLIVVPIDPNKRCELRFKAPVNSKAKRISDITRSKAMRLLGLRYWSQFRSEVCL